MQRKYSYIINKRKRKEVLDNNEENTLSNFSEDLDEVNDVSFDSIFSSVNSLEKSNQNKYYESQIICKCGHHYKNDNLSSIFFMSNIDIFAFNLNNNIKCPKCNSKLDIVNSIKLSSAYSYTNVFRKKFFLFEEEKKIRLVFFGELIQYNKKGKVFIQKIRKSITFNIEEKRFFYSESSNNSNKKTVIGISNRNFFDVFSNFFKEAKDDKVCLTEINTQNVFRNYYLDVIKPLNRFMNILTKSIESKDFDRVMKYVDFINSNDFDFHFRESNLSLNTFFDNSKKDYHDIKEKNFNIINEYIRNLSIIASVLQYPYNANILFIKGKEFFSDILRSNILTLPNSSYLKKEKPSSPVDIIIESFKFKILYQLNYSRKYLKSSIRNDYPNLILNDSNIEKLKKLEEFKENNNSDLFPFNSVLSHVKAIEWLKKDLNRNENKIFLPKVAFNKINSWDNLIYFTSISKYIDKKQILYLCDKFDLNDFIYLFKRINNIYHYENIEEKSFYNFESKIQTIKYILKISKEENLILENFPYDYITDILRCLKELRGSDVRKNVKEIFKCKNIQEITDLHDNVYKKVLIKNNKDNDEKIRNFCNNFKEIKYSVVDNVSFKLIDNIDDLLEEGSFMHHCVGTYASQLAQGKHLIFSVKDLDTEERATLEFYNLNHNGFFEKNTNIWNFNQLKSKYNSKASKNIIEKFKIFNKKLQKSGLQTKVNENSYDLLIKDEINTSNQVVINDFINNEDEITF